MPAPPEPPEPDLDAPDLPVDPVERQALRLLVMEFLGDNVLPERRIALVDAVERRDGVVWLAAVAAGRAFDDAARASGINVKAELTASETASETDEVKFA